MSRPTPNIPWQEVVERARWAPSRYNSQPWQLEVTAPNQMWILPELSRSFPSKDPNPRALSMDLGALLENVLLVGQSMGYAVHYTLHQTVDAPCLITEWEGSAPTASALAAHATFPAQTYQRLQAAGLPEEAMNSLQALVPEAGVLWDFIAETDARQTLQRLMLEAHRQQCTEAAFREEVLRWVRFGSRQSTDGLPGHAFHLPPFPPGISRRLAPLFLTASLSSWLENRRLKHAPLVAVLGTETDQPQDWIALGRSFQRLNLQLARLGLAFMPHYPVIDVEPARQRLAELPFVSAKHPGLCLQIGVPRKPEKGRHPRRSPEELLTIHTRASRSLAEAGS